MKNTPVNDTQYTNKTTPIVTIQNLSHEGRGIAKIQGKTVFVNNALHGEKIQIKIKKKHRRFDEAEIETLIEPSPHRVTPRCPHFEQCGGCQLQHLAHDQQMNIKQSHLIEQLEHFGGVKPQCILPPLIGPLYGYRRKARLGVKFVIKKDKLLVGFREKQSNKLADLTRCEILEPDAGELISPLQTLISDLKANHSIPQIEVAIGDQIMALVFRHMIPLEETDLEKLRIFVRDYNQTAQTDHAPSGHKKMLKIYLQPGNNDSVHPLYQDQESSSQELLSYGLQPYPLKLEFHPLDFIQINREINQSMVVLALKLLDLKKTDRVLDLFCGLGNFTLPMALEAAEVVGVEGEARAIRRATSNAKLNHLNNVEFFVQDLHSELIQAPWLDKHYDKILIDPPRTGALQLLDRIAVLGAKKIVYVSCNPSTLARDLGILVNQHGYKLVSAGIMDMFPHTAHVESIALLEK